jgi:PAS domain S-box-containing protein
MGDMYRSEDEAKWDTSSARASSPPSQAKSDTQTHLDHRLLGSSKDLLASILTSSLDGIMAFRSVRNEAGEIVDFAWLLANPASEALTGRKARDLIGKRLLEEMPGNREEGLFDCYVRVVETGEPYHREFYYGHEGIQRWFVSTSVKLGDGFAVTFRDVSEQKRAEDEKFAMAAAEMGTFELELPSRSLRASASTEQLFGLEPGEQRPLDDYLSRLHPDDADVLAQAEKSLNETGEAYLECRVQRQGGGYRWLAMRGKAVRDASGQAIKLIGAVTDISERRALVEKESLARQDASDAHARLAFLAEASHLLASSLEVEATLHHIAELAVPRLADGCAIHLVNEGELELFAVSHRDPAKTAWAEALLARYPALVQTPYGAYRVFETGEPLFYPRIDDALLAAIAHDEMHLERLREAKLVSAMLVPLKARDKVMAVVNLFASEPRQPYSEADLALAQELAQRAAVAIDNARHYQEAKRLNEELEARVKARTAELEASNKELEAFSYRVSHDLRSPLRSVNGFCHLLLEDYGERLEPGAREYVQRCLDATERMSEVLEALLSLSRVARNALEEEAVDLSELAREIVRELQASAPKRHAEVTVMPGCSAWGDKKLLELALQNLLENAWKFSAKAPKTVIRFGRQADAEVPTFFVEDNGAGFDMHYARELFTPFKRLHTVEEFSGSGIGLATVQRIVERHGGRIWAESEPGSGARFYFSLPKQVKPR